jgi:hypothetical protein
MASLPEIETSQIRGTVITIAAVIREEEEV